MEKRVLAVLLFFIISFPLSAQITFGLNKKHLGQDQGDSESWKPFFFDLDTNKSILIPDFYKGRVAQYNSDYTFEKAFSILTGLVPLINFNAKGPQGFFVFFSQSILTISNENGSLLEHQRGLTPTRLLPTPGIRRAPQADPAGQRPRSPKRSVARSSPTAEHGTPA